MKKLALICLPVMLAACSQSGQPKPGEVAVYDGIGESETVTLLGTEPFWNMQVEHGMLTYSTPENMAGSHAAVTRFAGNGGIGYSGTLDGQDLHIAVTPGDCSDGMSERTYPFVATITLGKTMLTGCGYTSEHDFKGEEHP